jgi:PAS domain-containing protein
MPSGVVLADLASGALTYRNRAAAALLDAEGDDLGTGLHFAGVDFTDERGAPVAPHELPLARTLSHGEALTRDLVVRRRNGDRVAVAINSGLVRDADGTATMAVAVLHDISELKRVALQLATEKERAQVTLAAIADGVIVTDSAGAITGMNPAAERLLEQATDMAQGLPVAEVVRFEEQDAVDALAAAIVGCQGERRTISDLPHATLHGRTDTAARSNAPWRRLRCPTAAWPARCWCCTT